MAQSQFESGNLDPKATAEFYAQKKQVDRLVIDYLSSTPDGVFGGGAVVGHTVRKFPLKGSVFVVGIVASAVVGSRFLWAGFIGAIAPAPIPGTAPIVDRIGNGFGRVTNVVFESTKPALGTVAVDYHYQFSGQNVATPSQPLESGSNMPGLVQVSNKQSTANPATDPRLNALPEQTRQVLEQLYK